MAQPVTTAHVSTRGLTTLPADLRDRWGIRDGGAVTFVDLGDAALLVPADPSDLQSALHTTLFEDGGYERGLASIEDPDLVDR